MEMLLWDFEGVVVGRASSTSKSAGVGVVENLIKIFSQSFQFLIQMVQNISFAE